MIGFRVQDGSFVASAMEGLFKVRVEEVTVTIGWLRFSFESQFATGVPSKDFCQAFGNTFSYLACNHETGVIAISNNDMHKKLVRKGKRQI